MLEFHITGGMNFMVPLSLLFLLNIGIIIWLFIATFTRKEVKTLWLDVVRHIGLFALVWGVFSTVIGLYYAFGALSQMQEVLPFPVIMGGLQVALITAEYGLIICVISLAAYLILKVLNRRNTTQNSAVV